MAATRKNFGGEAVKLVIEGGVSAYEASRQLSLPKSMLENWVRAFKAGKHSNIGANQRPLTEVECELAQVKQERNILKKAATYCEVSALVYLLSSRCTVRDGQKNDEEPGQSISFSCCISQAASSWLDSSFRPGQPILRHGIPIIC